MSALPPGWYVLLYHDVSWEEPPELRGIGGMVVPPDRFREQLAVLDGEARLIAADEARERLREERPDEPWVSVWFDDGYAGVRRYAAPLLAGRGLTATVSVCSRFTLREEMYWRAELGWLGSVDGLRRVRSRLRGHGVRAGSRLRDATLDRFCPEGRAAIAEVYAELAPAAYREDAFRLFDTLDGLQQLRAEGWTLANHSAAHWPIGEPSAIAHLESQFDECARRFAAAGLELSGELVLPFDRIRAPELDRVFDDAFPDDTLVLVGNRPTTRADLDRRRIHRIVAPPVPGRELLQRLRRCAPV